MSILDYFNPWLKKDDKVVGPKITAPNKIPVLTPAKVKTAQAKQPKAPLPSENPWSIPMLPKPKPAPAPAPAPQRYVQQGDAVVDTKTGKTIGYKREAEAKSMEAGNEKAKEGISKVTQMFVGDPIRAAVKAASRPKTLGSFLSGRMAEGVYNAVTEKPVDINITPKSPVIKAIFGEEPITGIGGGTTGRVAELAGKLAERFNIPKDYAERGAQSAMLPFMLLAADPSVGPGKKLAQEGVEQLVKEATEKFGKEMTEKLLKEGGEEALTKLVGKQATKIKLGGLLDADGEAITKLGSKIEVGAKSMSKGPIDVVDTGEGMMVLDGQHRAFEALQKGKTDIEANILTRDEALKKYGDRVPGLEGALEASTPRPAEVLSDASKAGGAGNAPPPPINTAEEAAAAAKADPEKWAASINLTKLNTADEVKTLIKTVADATKKEHAAAARGVQDIATTRALADQLGLSYDDMISRKVGQTLNAEQQEAYSKLLIRSAEDLKGMEDKLMAGTATDADLSNYAQALNRHALIQQSASGARAEAGRALNILKYNKDAATTLPEKLHAEVIKNMGGRKNMEEIAGALISARKAAEQNGDYRQYFDLIRQSTKRNFGDYIYEYWINSILSNPKTHLVNTISNAAMGAKRLLERGAQATIELARGGNREVTFTEVGHSAMGGLYGIVDGARRAIETLKNGQTMEALSKLDYNKLPVIGGKAGSIVRTPTRLLSAADEFFKAISYRSEIYAQAYRTARKEGKTGETLTKRMMELIDNPTENMVAAAHNEALAATFQQELGSIGQGFMRLRNKIPLAKYLVPFMRTPTNIFKEAARTTPLSLLEAGYKAVKGAPTEEVTRTAAKGLVGTAITVPIVMAYLNGKLTGSTPQDPAERDAFYRQGKKPIAIKVGNQWLSLSRVEPFATVIGAVADITNSIKAGEDVSSSVLNVFNTVANAVHDKTFLQSVSDALDATNGTVNEKSYMLKKLVLSVVTGFEPQFLAQTARTIDPTYRDVTGDGFLDQLAKTIASRTPFLSKSIPATLDLWGNEAKRSGGVIERFISPFDRGINPNDPVDAELSRLDISVGKPAKSKQVGGIKNKLDTATYQQYLKDAGQIAHARLVQLVSLPEYKNLSDDDKTDIIKETIDQTRTQVSQLKTGELLLSLAGVKPPKDEKVLNSLNELYSQIITTDEWKAMNEEEKIKMLMDDYSTLVLRYSNDQSGKQP